MSDLAPIDDGDQGAVYRFTIKDGINVRDLSSAAVAVYVEDENGNSLGMRPGAIVSPKSAGKIDVFFRGRETDWDGKGKNLVLIPKFYYAMAPGGLVPAANVLLNPSFDTASGSNPSRLPTDWSQSSSGGTFDNYANDPAPPSIFGTFQLVNNPTGNFLYQNFAPSPVPNPGDEWSFGVWVRGSGISGVEDDFNSILMEGINGSYEYDVKRMPVGEFDWRFIAGSKVWAFSGHTIVRMSLLALSPHTGSWRFDDAFMFSGRWLEFYGERLRVKVKSRPRVPKTANQIAGIGSFEVDTNGDGVADGFAKIGAGGTFSIDKTPANVAHGFASQKVVLTDQTSMLLRYTHRCRVKPGDTWRLAVKEKTSGTLGAGAGTGGFGIALSTQYFDQAVRQEAFTSLSATSASFAEHSASLAITGAERSELVIEIRLNGKTGTLWLDDLQLTRTVEGP